MGGTLPFNACCGACCCSCVICRYMYRCLSPIVRAKGQQRSCWQYIASVGAVVVHARVDGASACLPHLRHRMHVLFVMPIGNSNPHRCSPQFVRAGPACVVSSSTVVVVIRVVLVFGVVWCLITCMYVCMYVCLIAGCSALSLCVASMYTAAFMPQGVFRACAFKDVTPRQCGKSGGD